MSIRVVRAAAGVVGGLVLLYGTYRLLGLGWSNLLSTVPWLFGGVVAHDAVLAPLVLLVGAAATRRLPDWVRAPATGALVVLGSLTLVSVPVLGRFGAKADNPTLLDRPYAVGWLIAAALVLLVAGVQALARRPKGAERG